MGKQVAVITGDLVNSRRLNPKLREQLYMELNNWLADESKQVKKGAFLAEASRGDSFQCFVKKRADALRYVLLIKFYLHSYCRRSNLKNKNMVIDARLSIGVGTLDFLSDKLAISDGEAFQRSGLLLEKLKGTSQGLGISIANRSVQEELNTLFVLLDEVLRKTTPMQAEVIFAKLQGKKEKQIAEELSIFQSAVNQRSKAAGWNAIDAAVKRFETLMN